LEGLAREAVTEEDIPATLRNRPTLNQFQQPYFNMYKELSSSRQYTAHGIAEIPYHAKILWLNENDITCNDERRDYLYFVSEIDGAYLKHFFDKNG
jgi:hypothetical protein